MDFSYSEDQESLRNLARKMLGDHATPQRLEALEQGDDRVDHELWRDMADAGLLGVCIPEEYGGSGLGLIDLSVILDEVGRAVAPVPVFATLVLGALPIAEFGTEEQKASLLPGVVSGETILTAALQEPDNPGPLAPTTSAVAGDNGDGWLLTGTKLCVPSAAQAKVVLVPARVGDEIAVFLVDPKSERVTLEPVETTNREIQYVMTLDEVAVPGSALLGDLDGGGDVLSWTVRRAMAGLCAIQAGVVEKAVRMTAEYATGREQFERPLAAFQAVSQRAANAYIDAEAVRLSAMAAIWRLSEGLEADADVSTAKYFAAEAAQRAVHAAQHIHGGVGVDLSYPLHRYFTWAKEIELTLGGGTQHLLKLGALIAGEAA